MARLIPYLETGRVGRVGALDYTVGAILMFAAWVLFQVIMQVPIVFLDPDMLQAALAQSQSGEAQPAGAGTGMLMLIAGIIIAPLSYLFHRLDSGTMSRIFYWVSWVGVALVVAGFVPMAANIGAGTDEATMDAFMAIIGGSPIAYGLILFSFIGGILGAWFSTRVIHGRTFTSLITAASRIRWSRMFWVTLLTLGLWALIQFVLVVTGLSEVYPNPDMSKMAPFVVATILFIPIQCAAEEIMFRGYLNQALARFIPSVLVVFAITSIAFGALHLANPEIATAKEDGTFWLTFSGYVLFGAVFCAIVWIENGLEAAIGVHIANNAFAATFVNVENSALPVPGMYLTPLADGGPGTMVMFLGSMVLVIGAVWLTRKPVTPAANVLAKPQDTVDSMADAETLEDILRT